MLQRKTTQPHQGYLPKKDTAAAHITVDKLTFIDNFTNIANEEKHSHKKPLQMF